MFRSQTQATTTSPAQRTTPHKSQQPVRFLFYVRYAVSNSCQLETMLSRGRANAKHSYVLLQIKCSFRRKFTQFIDF